MTAPPGKADPASPPTTNQLHYATGPCGWQTSCLYFADVIAFRLDPGYPAVRARAEEARDRILNRPPPVV
jgi:hypothetical protein